MSSLDHLRTPPVELDDRPAVCQFLVMYPRSVVVHFAVRCAERVAPQILDSHPESLERLNAVESVLRVLNAWASGGNVSRFTLRLVRDVAYDMADVCTAAGPTLYAAAAAIDDDPSRSVFSAMREAQRLGADDTRRMIERDITAIATQQGFGPLWSDGEPEVSQRVWATLQSARPNLIRLFELPSVRCAD